MWITNLIFCTYGQMVFAIWSVILDSCQNMIFIWRWRRRVWCLRGKCNWIGRRFWDHFIYSMYLRRRIYHRLCSICFRLGGWFLLFVCLLGSLPNFLLQNDFKNVQWKLQFILWIIPKTRINPIDNYYNLPKKFGSKEIPWIHME